MALLTQCKLCSPVPSRRDKALGVHKETAKNVEKCLQLEFSAVRSVTDLGVHRTEPDVPMENVGLLSFLCFRGLPTPC